MKEYLANPDAFASAAPVAEVAPAAAAAQEEEKVEEKEEESDDDMVNLFKTFFFEIFLLMRVRRDSGCSIRRSIPGILRGMFFPCGVHSYHRICTQIPK